MKLHFAAPSPYSRKVRIAMAVRGLADSVTLVKTTTGDAADPVHRANPLGKIPTLVLDDGSALYDSRVICEYIDSIGTMGEPLFPSGANRWPALRLQALGDGIADAALLAVYEKRLRPENMWHAPWIEKQLAHVANALDVMEVNPPATGAVPNIGDIALATSLGYLDFRLKGEWRKGRPNLVTWLEGFAANVPAFAQTAPG